jgi:ribosome-binding protein aMBF1 (putative translation factor)
LLPLLLFQLKYNILSAKHKKKSTNTVFLGLFQNSLLESLRLLNETVRRRRSILMEKSIISADYRLFLDFLKRTREDVGVTQNQIAKKLKITQSQVSKIERGERRLDFIELRRWLRALRIPVIDFVTGFETYLKKHSKTKSSQE